MSRDKGNRAPHWVADYLRPWWPHVEALPNGRSGADLTGTPPVAFEIKTGAEWRSGWLKQAAKYAGVITPVIYLPPGCGAAQVARAQFIVPLEHGMTLLEQAGYTGVLPGLEIAQ